MRCEVVEGTTYRVPYRGAAPEALTEYLTVVEQACAGPPGYGLLALPGVLSSPAHPSDVPCCGVRNISLQAGSNAVNSLNP